MNNTCGMARSAANAPPAGGWAVFAQANAVVREDPDRPDLHNGRQPDGGSHVVREDQEGRAIGDEAAVHGQPVDDGAHAVLAHAPVDVPAGAGGREAAAALDVCAGALGQVGRAAHQLRQLGGKRLSTVSPALRVARPLASAAKVGRAASQPAGSSPASRRLSSAPWLGVGRLVGGQPTPSRPLSAACQSRRAPADRRPAPRRGERSAAPAASPALSWPPFSSAGPERLAVGLGCTRAGWQRHSR